ncbi:MAG: class I SAM-dependent methyltransferase [Candidatus Hermodarchaeota archaeon]
MFVAWFRKFLEGKSGHILIDQFEIFNLYAKFISFKAGLKFKKLSLECATLDDYYSLVDSFFYSLHKKSQFKVGIKLFQKKEEIIEFLKLYYKIKPKIILEIGTYDGGTLSFLTRCASEDAILITIDLPSARAGRSYSPIKIPFYRSFKLKNQKIYFLRLDSHKPIAKKKVKKILKKKKLDVLFIDGDHTYKGVKQDFEDFCPFVKKEGLIAFHDIVEHSVELNCGVYKLWNELKKKYNYKEFISNDGENWAGIGVIKYN